MRSDSALAHAPCSPVELPNIAEVPDQNPAEATVSMSPTKRKRRGTPARRPPTSSSSSQWQNTLASAVPLENPHEAIHFQLALPSATIARTPIAANRSQPVR